MPPPYAPEPDRAGGRRQGTLAGLFVVLALVALYMPTGGQQQVAWILRASLLRPFIALQAGFAEAGLRRQSVDLLQIRLDSLSAVLAGQGALAAENRLLRALLGLAPLLGSDFRPASLIRPATPGSESMFILDAGASHGVREGSPVVDPSGLLGVVREVRATTSVGIDWTHPDFRASAMLEDGSAFGLVETIRGRYREEDRLVLTGIAFYETAPEGTLVLTSGLGGVFPRGIPIGTVDGVAEAEGRWRKSYWLRPRVHPAGVTHVLVETGRTTQDLSTGWPAAPPGDTVPGPPDSGGVR